LGDAHGLVVEEAMASGLPVISSGAAGDIRLRVPDGVAGFVVPPADPELLAERMRIIANDPSATRQMAEAAAAIASGRGRGRCADDFERFVERILAMPKAHRQIVTSAGARNSRPHVIYWNNIPAPYMVERFNTVVRRGNIDLEAWFGARTEPDRRWTVDESSWEFPYRYLPRVGVGQRQLSLPASVLTERRPDLLVSLYATPSFLAGLRLAWWRDWRTALWVEVTFDSWVRRRRWKEALKRRVFTRVDGIITAGQDGRAFAMRYGVSPERIHIARHVVDTTYFASEVAAARPARDEIRAALGVTGVVFLYVGRLWWGKGVRPLLAAYASLARDPTQKASLLIVGDGPEEARIARMCERDGLNVKLTGFQQRANLPHLYAAGDVFVFPTLGDPYGLVIDEAMAAGLPVISTTAAGEIRDRVIDDVNGYLVPPNDPLALAAAMRQLASDPALRSRMGARSAEMIAPYTPDHWAEAFEKAVEVILASPRTASQS
jgi:glycosyltransferase involved in cell wall biosynthesis